MDCPPHRLELNPNANLQDVLEKTSGGNQSKMWINEILQCVTCDCIWMQIAYFMPRNPRPAMTNLTPTATLLPVIMALRFLLQQSSGV